MLWELQAAKGSGESAHMSRLTTAFCCLHTQYWVMNFVWFDSLLPINNLSIMYGLVLLGWTSPKLGLMCLAQGHNAVTPVRLESTAPRSRVKHSTTEPLHSLSDVVFVCLILYVPSTIFQLLRDGSSWVWTSTKLGIMCLAQGHNTVTPERLEPVAPRSRVKHYTTEPRRSHWVML